MTCRDLPVIFRKSASKVSVRWKVAFENVTDPAHVAVAHHNIVSNRQAFTMFDVTVE